mmetsp:Transcript_19526/g.30018  ORF Transcript_19526/g.30018 Transcript_19526/m.30018 type:complete len:115 (-) Transcript_19526:1505-1849(-)
MQAPVSRNRTLALRPSFSEAAIVAADGVGIALQASIVHPSNFDDGGTVLHIFESTFFSRLVVRIQRPVAFDAVQFNAVTSRVRPSSLFLLGRAIVEGASLRSDPHDLGLISSAF